MMRREKFDLAWVRDVVVIRDIVRVQLFRRDKIVDSYGGLRREDGEEMAMRKKIGAVSFSHVFRFT